MVGSIISSWLWSRLFFPGSGSSHTGRLRLDNTARETVYFRCFKFILSWSMYLSSSVASPGAMSGLAPAPTTCTQTTEVLLNKKFI